MSKFKAVLFDFDGTIMDTNTIILKSWQHTFN
ncbi:MAG: HAD hydrolase-like protein, partial [Firmicutes bacterium]|nr:HAD hydrolase-like protein [Bacillota bacterium]